MTPPDIRESIVNDRQIGLAHQIALPTDQITSVHGIVIDMDPAKLREDNPVAEPSDDADEMLRRLDPILRRHPLARYAEVRATGTGLHAIIWLRPAVELTSAAAQEWWADVIGTLQLTLPSDANAPTITAMTRPIGAVNSKNGQTVRTLRAGSPVAPDDVEAFVKQVAAAPFKSITAIWFGSEAVSPCPVCRNDASRLRALDLVGLCYTCARVHVDQLIAAVMVTEELEHTAAANPATQAADRAGRKNRQPKAKAKGPTSQMTK